MVDPLSEIVALLQPSAAFLKVVTGSGAWCVRRSEVGRPYYCVVLEGASRLAAAGQQPITLQAGDFVLIPAADSFTMSSVNPEPSEDTNTVPIALADGAFRLGSVDGPPNAVSIVGYCAFGSPDAALLVSLLPKLVLVRGEKRLATLVQLVGEESRQRRPARDVILTRLLEVLLIEVFRSAAGTEASPGLLRGLADPRLAAAIRCMHEKPTEAWTVARLAKEAALSRSAFFERFKRAVGVAPMEYLLGWRMALAKNLLRQKDIRIAEVAERVGYSSASTFSVAFTRHVGHPPTHYAQSQMEQ